VWAVYKCKGLKLVNIWNSGTESCEKCGRQFGEQYILSTQMMENSWTCPKLETASSSEKFALVYQKTGIFMS
jgi:hypothetical protein